MEWEVEGGCMGRGVSRLGQSEHNLGYGGNGSAGGRGQSESCSGGSQPASQELLRASTRHSIRQESNKARAHPTRAARRYGIVEIVPVDVLYLPLLPLFL